MNNNLNFFLYIMLTNNTQNKYFLKVFCSVRLLIHLLPNFYEQHEKIILRQILITKVANTIIQWAVLRIRSRPEQNFFFGWRRSQKHFRIYNSFFLNIVDQFVYVVGRVFDISNVNFSSSP